MPRSLSPGAIAAIQASSSEVAFFALVKLSHPNLATPIYICNNNEDMVNGGNTYRSIAFTLNLLDEAADALPNATISIDNVSQDIFEALRGIQTPVIIDIKVVTSVTPDVVEVQISNYKLVSLAWNELKLTAQIVGDDVLNQRWPADTYTPGQFAGLF